MADSERRTSRCRRTWRLRTRDTPVEVVQLMYLSVMLGRIHRRAAIANRSAVRVAIALMIAGCGGGSDSTAPTPPTGPLPVAAVSISGAPTQPINAGDTLRLTAVTTSASGSVLTGRAVVWSSSSENVASISQAGLVNGVEAGTTLITATSEGKVATATIQVNADAHSDIAIVSAIWTQGTQDPGDPFPMVAGAPAALNVYLRRAGAVANPGRITLVVSDASGAVVRLDSVAPSFIPTSPPGFGEPSAQFLLHGDFVQPGMLWQVVRDRGGIAPDDSAGNDLFPRDGPAAMSAVVLPVMRLRFVPIVLAAHGGTTGNVDPGNTAEYLRSFRATHPPGRLDVDVGAPFVTNANFGAAPNGGGSGFWIQLLQELDAARIASFVEPDAYWYGIVRPPPGYNFVQFGGFGFIPTAPQQTGPGTRTALSVAINWFANPIQARELVAHELGHNMGRSHSPCGNPAGIDPAYPFSNGAIGIPGHDVHAWSSGQASVAATVGGSTADVMGYCLPMWSSVYTYRAFLNVRLQNPGPALMAPRVRERVLVVSGSAENGIVTLVPPVALTGYTTADEGDFTVELVDARGSVLASRRARGAVVDHAPARVFTAAIPLDASLEERVAEVRVRHGALVRARREQVAPASRGTVQRRGESAVVSCPAGTRAIAVTSARTGELLAIARGSSARVVSPDQVDASCNR